MAFEAQLSQSADAVIDELNNAHRHHAGISVLRSALNHPSVGSTALVSSFGAESVALLHMLSKVDPATPVLLIDTELLFPETLAYLEQLSDLFGLTNVVRITGSKLAEKDPFGDLHKHDTDACCALRKVEPLEKALMHFDAWITGRKRFQTTDRAALEHFEADANGRIKINPLAHWRREDVQDYIENNRLPKHPLVDKGYKSIGCMPCTSPVKEGEDDRAGRWSGDDKCECGIHFENGRIVRSGATR